ncbi:MAG: hypothetical protein ACYS76_06360 [Planctomycetota bacterium]|jgi:hypothetical protein
MDETQEEGKDMKTRMNCLVLAFVWGSLCVPGLGRTDVPLTEREPGMIGSPDRILAGVKDLYVVMVSRVPGPCVWKELEAKVEGKLHEAGFKTGAGVYLEGEVKPLNNPELRVYIDVIKLENLKQCVFHIQTAVATKVFLEKDSLWFRKVEVWRTPPTMQAASAESLPEGIEQAVLEQVEGFITACLVANAQAVRWSGGGSVGTAGRVQARGEPERRVGEYGYVGSKNSRVFHRTGCRWAQRISPENLVSYSTREEAITGGKRPCRQCKP